MRESGSQDSDVLLPFERQALTENYRRNYVAKRKNFFSNILQTYGLWRYFQLLDRNLEHEIEWIDRHDKTSHPSAVAAFSKAHAKIRIAIELAFADCMEEARPIMKDAIWLAAWAHHVHADTGLLASGRSRGCGTATDVSAAFRGARRAIVFKGQPVLRARWMRLEEMGSDWARPLQSNGDAVNCASSLIFEFLKDVSLIEKLIFEDHHRRLHFDSSLVRNRAGAAELGQTLSWELEGTH